MIKHLPNTAHKNRATWFALVSVLLMTAGVATAEQTPLDKLLETVPQSAERHNLETAQQIRLLVTQVESWIGDKNSFHQDTTNETLLTAVLHVLNVESILKKKIDDLYKQRTSFIRIENARNRHRAARGFLECATELIKLSGRIRYYSVDFFSEVGYELEEVPDDYEALIDIYIAHKNSVGAITSLELLAETLRSPSTFQFSDHLKGKILKLARVTRELQLLPTLAEILRQKDVDRELAIFITDTIRHIGLPQFPRPGDAPALSPPAVMGDEILAILLELDTTHLSPVDKERHQQLIDWLAERNRHGIVGDEFQFGGVVIREGDWLLMKNPSPYNRFTDLYPGLFTHAGIITTEIAKDGRRRFVVVDLPEVGNTIPATPVEKFVERTLDFVILRHHDAEALKTMGRVANTIIGNSSKFDLNFRTTEIENLKGQSLQKKRIDGYCAGLLLLCAQETGKSLQEFFPLEEHPAGGNTLLNLAQLDISMPRRFLSPTGPLFSSHVNMVYRCETMYSPRRQIEQAIYDHFAQQMRDGHLTPSLNWYHTLRLNLAQAADNNPALGKALANVVGVNENIDLVAAAKLGAVVESLDAIAKKSSSDYQSVRSAFRLDVLDEIEAGAEGDEVFDQIIMRRRRHADLFVRWEAGVLTPRKLRMALVDYYIQQGCAQLDDRFFHNLPETVKDVSEEQTGS
jgi:hypothetical protein